MNAIKAILNVLGTLLAIPLTLILVVWLMCVPLVASVSSWVQTDTLKQIVREVDYEAFLQDVEADDEYVQGILETGVFADIILLYVEDLIEQFDGAPVGSVCTEEAVRNCFETNMDELLPLFRQFLADEENIDSSIVTDAELEKKILEMVDESIPELIADLPKAEDLCAEMGMDLSVVQTSVKMLRSGTLTRIAIIVAVVLTLAIFILRLYRLRGFIWLSVVYFINAGIAVALSKGVSLGVTELTTAGGSLAESEVSIEAAAIVAPLLKQMADLLMTGGIIYAVVAIVCVAAAVLFHNYRVKRSQPRPANIGPEL